MKRSELAMTVVVGASGCSTRGQDEDGRICSRASFYHVGQGPDTHEESSATALVTLSVVGAKIQTAEEISRWEKGKVYVITSVARRAD